MITTISTTSNPTSESAPQAEQEERNPEIYRKNLYRVLTVTHHEGWVQVAIENHEGNDRPGVEVWLTPDEARKLATERRGTLKGIDWCFDAYGGASLAVNDKHHRRRGCDMELPEYAVDALVDALLLEADEAEAFET